MAEYDWKAREANADLRKLLGKTPEVERAIKKTQWIRRVSETDIDYAHTLAEVYHQITGGNNGHPDGRPDSRNTVGRS